MDHKHILITGGAGFVGSSIAVYLKHAYPSVNVTIFDNLLRRGSELNLKRLETLGISFVHGDVRILADLSQVNNVDVLIECSAEPSVLAGSNGSPNYVLETNLTGAINCAEYCRQNNAAMIFLSTSRRQIVRPLLLFVHWPKC